VISLSWSQSEHIKWQKESKCSFQGGKVIKHVNKKEWESHYHKNPNFFCSRGENALICSFVVGVKATGSLGTWRGSPPTEGVVLARPPIDFISQKKTHLCKIFFLNWFCLRLATANFPIWGGILFDLKIIFSFCSTFGASKKSTLKDIFCISSEHPIKISHSIQWILKWN
jgi:hypothetical protein